MPETLEWDEYLDIEDITLIEHVRATGRLESISRTEVISHLSHELERHTSEGGWEISEEYCAQADRSSSAFFTDELIERRRRHRVWLKVAQEVEQARRSRLIRKERARVAQERARADEDRRRADEERARIDEQSARPDLSPIANSVLALLTPGARWTVQSMSSFLGTTPFIIQAAVYELVQKGRLNPIRPPQVPWP